MPPLTPFIPPGGDIPPPAASSRAPPPVAGGGTEGPAVTWRRAKSHDPAAERPGSARPGHAVPAAARAPGQAGRAPRAAREEAARGHCCSHVPDRGPDGPSQRRGGPGLREPEEAGPRGEDAADPSCPVRQADGPVDQHGGELQPGTQGDRRRGELGAQHRDGHADDRHCPGVRLQGAAAALRPLSPRQTGAGPAPRPGCHALCPTDSAATRTTPPCLPRAGWANKAPRLLAWLALWGDSPADPHLALAAAQR